MQRKVRFSPEAQQDLRIGVEYYNKKTARLGSRFVSKTKKAILKISQMSHAASFIFDEFRYKVIDSFPYIIIYDFDDKYINIFRIFNTHLNPESIR